MYNGFSIFISNVEFLNSYAYDGMSAQVGVSTNIILNKHNIQIYLKENIESDRIAICPSHPHLR
jgi:hypothetical protein